MSGITREHIAIDVRPGVVMESQSGLQNLRPRIFGVLAAPSAGARVAAIVMHPTSNYMGHYLLDPLARRGIACLGLNSRYAGNDALLQMERVIQDLGAGVQFLRNRGYRTVVLIGNSGGASLAAFYQSQAENLTATHFVEGGATGLTPSDLPPGDAIILSAAHTGRSRAFVEWLDPSVVDESDPYASRPELDLFAEHSTPPFGPDFLARYRAEQVRRRNRIEAWVEAELASLPSRPGAPADRIFLVYRTHADPRFLDFTLDANDRVVGSVWGDPRTVNYAANAFGRVTSLRSFMSQFSSRSIALGPECLAGTSIPVLLLVHTADASAWPSTRDEWLASAGGRILHVDVVGGDHYLVRQPPLVEFSADVMEDWIRKTVA